MFNRLKEKYRMEGERRALDRVRLRICVIVEGKKLDVTNAPISHVMTIHDCGLLQSDNIPTFCHKFPFTVEILEKE